MNTAFGNASCEQKLQDKEWPLDCFLLLHLHKSSGKQLAYKDLNQWCHLNSTELWKKPPPPAIFTLSMPTLCLKAAKVALKHHRAKEILRGSFLNSFP